MSLQEVRELFDNYNGDNVLIVRNLSPELIKHLNYCYICYDSDIEAVICSKCCYNHVCVVCGAELKQCPICRQTWTIMFMLVIDDRDVVIDRVLKNALFSAVEEMPDISDDDEEYVEQVEEKNANADVRILRVAAVVETLEILRAAEQYGNPIDEHAQILSLGGSRGYILPRSSNRGQIHRANEQLETPSAYYRNLQLHEVIRGLVPELGVLTEQMPSVLSSSPNLFATRVSSEDDSHIIVDSGDEPLDE